MGNHAENPVLAIEQLSEQVQHLKSEMQRLSGRLATLEKEMPAQQDAHFRSQGVSAARQARTTAEPPSLVDTSALLPRISTICFLLVIALILRTITDNQIINTQVGSILGMTYAGLLILIGWRLYARKSRLAPVFPGCGILLLFSVVLETHRHFESLSTNGAYTILFLAGAVVFAMSIRYHASVLVCLGVTGTAAVALTIDFPYPVFPVLGLLLLSAIIAGSYAFKQNMCRYLRWSILFLASIFWLLWTTKMNTLPSYEAPLAAAMYPSWFFPMLFCFWGVYLLTVLLNVLKKDLQLGFFESMIPTVTAVGTFGAGYVAVSNLSGKSEWFYLLLIAIATLHLGVAWWLARHDHEKASGANVFILAGSCLIFLATSVLFRKNVGYIMPVWSASALFLVYLSAHLHNEGIRITSYFLQIVTCFAALATGAILVPSKVPLAAGLASLCLCIFSIAQYTWSRSHAPDKTNSFFFSKVDKNNYSAVILLVTGLLGGFYFAQFILHQGLSAITDDFASQFKSGQSLIINIGALILMAIALKKHSKEIIIIASIVALIGAGKVFIFDMFGIKGVSLVLSVFSTGVVAAFGSVVMGKWQKKEAEPA